jgi:hypothetical protein
VETLIIHVQMEVTLSRLPMIHKDSKLIMWGMKNLITLTDIADLARIRIFVQDYHPLFRKAWCCPYFLLELEIRLLSFNLHHH